MKRTGAANSPLAHYTGVHFKIASTSTVLAEPYASQVRDGVLTHEAAVMAVRERNNIAVEYRIKLRAVKSAAV